MRPRGTSYTVREGQLRDLIEALAYIRTNRAALIDDSETSSELLFRISLGGSRAVLVGLESDGDTVRERSSFFHSSSGTPSGLLYLLEVAANRTMTKIEELDGQS